MKFSRNIRKTICVLLSLAVFIGVITLVGATTNTDETHENPSAEEAIVYDDVSIANSDEDEWLKSFVVSQDEWLKDHEFDPDLLTLEEGYEVVTETSSIYNESEGVYESIISVMKRPISDSDELLRWTPNCCSKPNASGPTEWGYYHNSAPHPTTCVYRTTYRWRCSNCGSSGTRITDTPRWCPSPSYFPD